MRLKRKIDDYLIEWKNRPDHLPLIVKGARQVGKTESIRHFASSHYKHVVEINFLLSDRRFKGIFDDGFEVDSIVRNMTWAARDLQFEPGKTLIFFDEMQDCPNCATSLKAFREDGRYDVICSGSLMGINYREIESNSVGNKEDVEMFSLDFEEFLWAKGFGPEQIESLHGKMLTLTPLNEIERSTLLEAFREHMALGGMPAVVARFIEQRHFGGTLRMQRQILLDYEEDITKYAGGLDKGKILSVFRKIPMFLGADNKKFHFSKIAPHARARDYVGVVEWLENAGIVNVCPSLRQLSLPIRGNLNPDSFKLYFRDTGLLVGSLDDETQDDLRADGGLNACKGALYENVVADMLVKQGYPLAFYRNPKGTVELDFLVRDRDSLIPVEVKAEDDTARSLRRVIADDRLGDIRFGIKLANRNIGFNGVFYTFPYFLAFLLRRYLRTRGSQIVE